MNSLIQCMCLPHYKFKENHHQATLVWKRTNINNQTVFTLDYNSCMFSCLKGQAYVQGSSEYIFQFGSGAVGNVWKNKKTQIVNVDNTSLDVFFRRDLAKVNKFHAIILAWVDEETIVETALSKHVSLLHIPTSK